jgi:hypothetical protein
MSVSLLILESCKSGFGLFFVFSDFDWSFKPQRNFLTAKGAKKMLRILCALCVKTQLLHVRFKTIFICLADLLRPFRFDGEAI